MAVGPIVRAGSAAPCVAAPSVAPAAAATGLEATGAGVVGVDAGAGTGAMEPHLGHFAFCDANEAGTRSLERQEGQSNSMVVSEGFVFIEIYRCSVKFDFKFCVYFYLLFRLSHMSTI